jgi:type IV pilus assembly protein PilY1
MRFLSLAIAALLVILAVGSPSFAQTMGTYTSYPPVMATSVKAGALIMMSNDWTGFTMGYQAPYDDSIDYYGYFDPNKSYGYSNGSLFYPYQVNTSTTNHYAPSGYWSGNFLNWLTMSHGDFLRKALTGGRRGTDAVAMTRLERGDVSSHPWTKVYTGSDLSQLSPYSNPTYQFKSTGVNLQVISGRRIIATMHVEVEVCNASVSLEANCMQYPTGNYKPQGILQHYKDKIDFGLMTYSHSKPDAGGVIRRNIGDISFEFSQANGQENSGIAGMIRYINNYTEKGWDPLGEMYFDALRFFKGLTTAGATPAFCPTTNSDDGFPVFGCASNKPWEDPVKTWCQKNSIIILNDEYPSSDIQSIPGSPFSTFTSSDFNINAGALTKAVGDAEGITGTNQYVGNLLGGLQDNKCNTTKFIDDLGKVSGMCPSEGDSNASYLLAGLTHYAMTEDIRPDMPGDQHVRTYAIAFRASPGGYIVPPPPMNPIWLAAKYGNFDDKNGNKLPDLPSEWDEDGDGNPNGYFYAESGSQVEDALVKAFEDVLKRSASGTAVSVLSTAGETQGNIVQAYYRPAVTSGGQDIFWTGYMQSLWVDRLGNMREDTNQNQALDETEDKVLRYFSDTDGVTRVRRYDGSGEVLSEVVNLDEIKPLWETGKRLANRSAGSRKIYTFIDKNKNQVVDSTESVSFDVASASDIGPYLNVQDATTTGHLGTTEANRVENLIQFIRGNDPVLESGAFVDLANISLRTRNLDGQTWKMGDIVHSTPVAISSPADNFGWIYSDASYFEFFNQYKNRETVVYVGANDGMLHAFTSWQFDKGLNKYIKPLAAPATEQIGDELWAYIPQNLLPHLKWLPRPDYTHVYYNDLQPKIFDARIFPDDADHPKGWGTVLISGMNTGGGDILVNGDFDNGSGSLVSETRKFSPSYVAIDITNPRNPKLMWERTYTDLNFSTSFPAVMRVGPSYGVNEVEKGKWYVVFGSGPNTYNGNSVKNGHIYVVDALSGKPFTAGTSDWLFETPKAKAFMGSPASIDKYLNYNVDAFYIGETYDDSKSAPPYTWKGTMYKVRIPWIDSLGYGDPSASPDGGYDPDPTNWQLSTLFESPGPITAPPNLSVDTFGNTWVYFGTGRFFSRGLDSDETSTAAEYLFGIKDPFFNEKRTSFYLNDQSSLMLTKDLLFDADPYSVIQNVGTVYAGGTLFGNFNTLLMAAREKDGWFRSLPVGTVAERSLNKPALLGGIAMFTSYLPEGDLCSFGGESYLNALYFETGTAYTKPFFNPGTETITVNGQEENRVLDRGSLGSGSGSKVGIYLPPEGGPGGGEAKVFVQQADGKVDEKDAEPALRIRSGTLGWTQTEERVCP